MAVREEGKGYGVLCKELQTVHCFEAVGVGVEEDAGEGPGEVDAQRKEGMVCCAANNCFKAVGIGDRWVQFGESGRHMDRGRGRDREAVH